MALPRAIHPEMATGESSGDTKKPPMAISHAIGEHETRMVTREMRAKRE